MSVPAQTSAAWNATLSAWCSALAATLKAIAAYRDEVGDAGIRTLGTRWKQAAATLDELANHGCTATSDSLAALFDALDRLESTSRRGTLAAETLLHRTVVSNVATGMSRSYSERLDNLVLAVKQSLVALANAQHSALDALRIWGTNTATTPSLDVSSATQAHSAFAAVEARGSLATELYVRLLVRFQTPEATRLLDEAKDRSLGGEPDTPERAAADSAALAVYHPCQTMVYVPMITEVTAVSSPLILTMPDAKLATTYELDRLTSRKRAAEFGPIASIVTGLNYKLVTRLRSISVVPIVGPLTDSTAISRDPIRGPITLASSASTSMNAPDPAAAWAPFGGPRPRVDAYAETSAQIVIDELRRELRVMDRPPDVAAQLRAKSAEVEEKPIRFEPEVLIAEYEAAVESGDIPAGDANPDILVDHLAAEFAAAYDAAPPTTPADFVLLVVPEEPGPKTYMCRATSRLVREMMAGLLRTYFKSIRRFTTPYAALEREARLTQSLFASDAALDLWRRFRIMTWVDPDMKANSRDAHLRHFKKIATKVVQSAPVRLCPPSLKMFYGLHA